MNITFLNTPKNTLLLIINSNVCFMATYFTAISLGIMLLLQLFGAVKYCHLNKQTNF